ncbi:MAG: ribosome biogenesis GTPase YlqF [Bacilli bacterium]|jgi:ribosome biogenesis GTPase A|nr:ribosome biogenesis GTPase YlqF [Bacilli bacterium]
MDNLKNTTINWYPGHMEKAKRLMIKEYKNIDMVYELVDARIPKSSKIKNIYDIIGNKPKLLIMTKKDLTDPIKIEGWIKYYENIGSKVVLADLNNDNDIKKIVNETHKMMEELQLKREEKGMNKKEIRVLVVGIPNVGKSTLINKLVGKRVANVGNKPGITKGLVWLKTSHNIALLDTPGILWPKIDNNEIGLNLASIFSIKTEILDVNEVAVHIINKLNRYYPEKLKERYNIEPSNLELDFEAIYEDLGKKMGAIRNGEPDYERISNRIINDIKDEYIKGVVFDNEI